MMHDGRVVTGVTAQNLRVKELKATIQNITLDASPRRVILVLDFSGSMGESDYFRKQKWDYARETAKTFLTNAPAQDLLALDVFAEKEKEIVPFTHDFASIRAAIDALPKQGFKPAKTVYGTNTYVGDALHAILNDTEGKIGFGDSIILFSDGEYEEMGGFPGSDTGKHPLGSVKEELEQRGVRVFLVLAAMKRMGSSDLPESFFRQMLVNVAAFMAQTGGFSFASESFSLDSADDPEIWQAPQIYRFSPLPKRMAALDTAIQGTYRLQLQLDQPLRKRRDLRLELINSKGKVLNTVFLFYPRSLYPDPPKTH